MASKPVVTGLFDPRTFSIQYVVADPETGKCAIIDPVLDYDEKSGTTATDSADKILSFVAEHGLEVVWVLDTHPHADHFTAAAYLKEKTGSPIAIGEKVVDVQKLWQGYHNSFGLKTNGSQWDRLFAHGDTFSIGNLEARVMFSPGHTLASITYVIGDAVFVHDTLFMPDSGTARADSPAAVPSNCGLPFRTYSRFQKKRVSLSGTTISPVGASRAGKPPSESRRQRTHMSVYKTEEEFVAARQTRDKTLAMPKLILHALQVNINAGRLPEPEANGRSYLKLPLNLLRGAAWG